MVNKGTRNGLFNPLPTLSKSLTHQSLCKRLTSSKQQAYQRRHTDPSATTSQDFKNCEVANKLDECKSHYSHLH